MNKGVVMIAAALVALVAVTGFAAATTNGVPVMDNSETDGGYGAGAGVPADDDTTVERPMDGSNSPWVTGDERLDRFQDRFDLTDDQMTEIQEEVQLLVDEGAEQDEIRSTVTDMLDSYGVEEPTLGPPADHGPGAGPGNGPGTGAANGGGYGAGNGGGPGPHGPADGSCQN